MVTAVLHNLSISKRHLQIDFFALETAETKRTDFTTTKPDHGFQTADGTSLRPNFKIA